MEEWKEIAEDKMYEVSSEGRVRSNYNTRGNRRLEPLILAGKTTCGNGYRAVSLGRSNIKYIHRLVAETFIPNTQNKNLVDHINRDRSDNRVCNLRWANNSLNMKNKDFKGNKSGERYIVKTASGTYMLNLTFDTLEEAIKYRDMVLAQSISYVTQDNDIHEDTK
jgi:hypothetical protein